jgi:hypothetical protein
MITGIDRLARSTHRGHAGHRPRRPGARGASLKAIEQPIGTGTALPG